MLLFNICNFEVIKIKKLLKFIFYLNSWKKLIWDIENKSKEQGTTIITSYNIMHALPSFSITTMTFILGHII